MTSTWKQLKNHPDLLPRYLLREKVVDAIRAFFKREGFFEAQTPLLVPAPSNEPYLEVFETKLLSENRDSNRAFLISSPEYSLKKLIAAGFPKIFEIARCFRNAEGESRLHNAEFTMLEWYRTDASYTDIMTDCEQLVLFIARSLKRKPQLSYQSKTINISPPWNRLSVAEAFRKYAGVSVLDLFNPIKFRAITQKKGYSMEATTHGEQLYHQIFLNEIEGKLGFDKPTILYDYPAQLSSYARISPRDPRYVERFEFYIAGIELGNAFSELIDPEEQRRRMISDQQERQRLGKTDIPLDEEFLAALATNLPPSAGIAVGVDRLVMLFADTKSIHETLFFPGNELFP